MTTPRTHLDELTDNLISASRAVTTMLAVLDPETVEMARRESAGATS